MSKMKWLGVVLALTAYQGAWAAQNTAMVTVNVTINTSPCEINNNQIIDVDFGDNVITTDVAKGVVEKEVNYTFDCTSADQSKTLAMTIKGAGQILMLISSKPLSRNWGSASKRTVSTIR